MRTREQNIKIRCLVSYTKTITVPYSWNEDQIDNFINNTFDKNDFTMYEPDNIIDLDWEYE